ncbi:MAG: fibronectin type III domain-containing protein, partial [Rudanella sp.]|nr:fibronectin type III domain-containing protein [Rudanella sp.]
MSTSSTRLLLLWAYAIMICLPACATAQTEPQKASNYCSVTYVNGCTGNNGLSSVQINDVAMSQNSGCSVSGYGQFTATSARLTPGQANTFAITLLDPTRPHGITIWADLNRNFSIDLGEDLYLSNGPLTGPISGTFTIPAGTASGPLRIRVLSAYSTMPFWPCSTNNGSPIIYEAGETEDYTVYVQGPITGLITTNITGNYAQLNWNSLGPGITYDVQWRQQGTATWSTGNASTNSFQPYLQLNTAYEWQVRETGTQPFSGPVSFTTLCTAPTYTSVTPYRAVAILNWNSSYNTSYTLQWRVAGTTDWTTISPSLSYSYSLTGLTPSTPYEWQVKANCSASVSSTFTPGQSFTTLSCQTPANPSAYNLLSNSAYLSWSAPTDPGRTFRLQYRPVTNPAWQTVENLTTSSYSLTGLTPNTPYEWQVQSVCSPTESTSYTPGPVFTPICPVPHQPSGNPTATGASFSWRINPAETINSFYFQYRQAGASDWTTISNLTPAAYSSYRSYALTGLSRNTAYEWRVLTNCALGTQSDYTAIRSFTTVCSPVYSAYIDPVSSTSTRLIWSAQVDADTRFEIRWRPTGAPDWTTISNLTITQNQGSYLLTGLTTNTLYELQIRTVCSPTESSSFAIGGAFTPRCPVPFVYTWQSGVPRVTSATITWYQTFPVAQYEVYYRPIGSA